MTDTPGPFITAAEAAALLGVERRTLYAYVARGLLRSYPGPGRHRRYAASEVRRLRMERAYRRVPLQSAADALQWGAPILRSQITTIRGGRLAYRGHDIAGLVGAATFEHVCALLWEVEALPPAPRPEPGTAERRAPVARYQAALLDLAEHVPATTRPDDLARAGVAVLEAGARAFGATGDGRLAERLARVWAPGVEQAPAVLEAALVALADHELTAASLAARCAASAGGGVPRAVLAGLCALVGERYAANTGRIAALLRAAGTPDALWETLRRRVRAGQPTPGFGHRLYPEGDPRTRALQDVLERLVPEAEGTAFLRAAATAGPGVVGMPPAVDFALVAACRAVGLPEEAPLWVFTLARSAGLVGHAAEQMRSGELIRPRAAGDVPG